MALDKNLKGLRARLAFDHAAILAAGISLLEDRDQSA